MKRAREYAVLGDGQNKRQQILDAAYIVFSRKGYHRATVDEIIALADTGKGTVYNYFVNKEQLFYTLIKERSAAFEGTLERIVEGSEPALEKVEHLIRVYLHFYVKNADLWRVMMHEVRGFGEEGYSHFTPEQRAKYQDWFKQTVGVLERVIIEGKEQGVIQASCDATRAAYSLFSVILTFVFRDFIEESVEDTAHMIANFLLHGIAR